MADENKTNLFGKSHTPATEESKPAVEAEPAKVEKEPFEVRYASPQIARLKIGKFQFEHGVLVIDNEKDAELFANLLDGASVRTKQRVTRIDREAGEAIASKFLASSRGQMIRGGDTSTSSPPAATPGDQQHVS
jgi:hypothetical protein